MNTRNIFLFLFCLSPFLLIGQEREERKVGSFNEIRSSNAIKVFLHQSNEERVIVEATNIDLEDVITDVSGSELEIYLDGNRFRNIDVKVNVYYRSLEEISASSASQVSSKETIKGDDFGVNVSSAASVEVPLDVNNLQLEASSAGNIKVSGKAHEMAIDVSSAGGVNAYDLAAELVEVDVSSAGSVKIHVTKSLKADASSGGSIRYKGNPARSEVNASSGGSVKRGAD